jgi:hypothetical protein
MSNFVFDINRFCQKNQTCAPVNYLQVKTSGNDPTISKRKLYSQYVNSSKFRRVNEINVNATQYNYVGIGKFIQTYPRTQQYAQPFSRTYTNANNPGPNGNFVGKFLY